MCQETRWFPLPDLYRTLGDPDTLKRYAVAYMRSRHPGWKPIKINSYRVLAERRGREQQDDAMV